MNLANDYKYIGEKVAFRQKELGYDYASFFNFPSKYFQTSVYICVVRDPIRVSASNIEMFMAGDANDKNILAVSVSQLQSYYLILCLAMTLPNVFVVAHERISHLFLWVKDIPFFGLHYDGFYQIDERNGKFSKVMEHITSCEQYGVVA